MQEPSRGALACETQLRQTGVSALCVPFLLRDHPITSGVDVVSPNQTSPLQK